MLLRIKNKAICTPIERILDQINIETGKRLFRDRVPRGDNLIVTCPNQEHRGGAERHPSCNIFQDINSPTVEYGHVHCFACGYNVSLPQMVADCFNFSIELGEEWLSERFGDLVDGGPDFLPPLEEAKKDPQYLSEDVLQTYYYRHPYMYQRKLKDWVIDTFEVGATADGQYITFPIRDEKGHLVGVSKRSTTSKYFHLPSFTNKPVYLLNQVRFKPYPFVVVCEGQLDALTAWGYGVPCVALLGTGSKHQFDILNKSGLRSYVTFFDNDDAGRKATANFNRKIRRDVSVINLFCNVEGKKDINDLTQEEFDSILASEGLNWRIPHCI